MKFVVGVLMWALWISAARNNVVEIEPILGEDLPKANGKPVPPQALDDAWDAVVATLEEMNRQGGLEKALCELREPKQDCRSLPPLTPSQKGESWQSRNNPRVWAVPGRSWMHSRTRLSLLRTQKRSLGQP